GTVYVINTTDTTKKDIVISASAIPSFSLPTNAPGQAHENINAPLFAQGNTVYVHTTRDNLYSLDTTAKGSQTINLSTVK
ncbi:MAG: hypothetical protein WAK60_04710, partial [Sedimentisphaerales bacterium]